MTLYHEVIAHLSTRDMDALKKVANEADLLDIVELIEDLAPDDAVVVFRLLDKNIALEVFEVFDVGLQQKLISAFREEERAVQLFLDMEPDDRARLLDELPARVAKKLLASLSPEEREKTAELLGYPPRTAGRIMTPEYIRLRRTLNVGEALETVKRNGENKETIYTLYVTDDTRTLEGVVSLKDLIMAPPEKTVEEIMTSKVVSVSIGTDQEEVARLLKDRDMLAVPVVDSEGRLVGIITIDDAIDVLEEETTDDFFDKVGLSALTRQEDRSLQLINGSLWEVWRVRLPFLTLTLVGGMLAGSVIDAFEQTLETIAAVAIFIPVIMDMGGNVGTQSSTIFTRALVLGHINPRKFMRHWLREVGVGISIGVIMGIAAGIIASVWQRHIGFGFAVGISLALTIMIGAGLGFLVPYILLKLGFDQAAGADPVVTTIKDISGLLIYFFMVSVFLGYLL